MDDVRRHEEGDAGEELFEQVSPRADGQPAIRNTADDPADRQLDERHENGRKKLDQSVIQQERGVLLNEDPSVPHVGKHPAQQPEGQDHRDRIDGVQDRQPDPDRRLDLIAVIGPHVDVIARVDGHAPGMFAVIFLRTDGPLIGPRLAVQGKCLPSHKAEDRAQDKEADHKIAGHLYDPGGGAREPFVCKPFHQPHCHHPLKFINVSLSIEKM